MLDPEIRKLILAAKQRLTSAGILANNSMFLDAMYIAGYAPECALKAIILSNVPSKDRAAFRQKWFHGVIAHDFEFLRALMKKQRITLPVEVARHLRRIATWSTGLRYETGKKSSAEALTFLQSAKYILQWVERSL